MSKMPNAAGYVSLAISLLLLLTAWKSHAADLPLPKSATPPELCLTTGKNPSPGQTLKADKTCPSGMRWVFQR